MDHSTLKSYTTHLLEIRRLEIRKKQLEAELRAVSLSSPGFEVAEGQNPNRNNKGISPKEIATATRINQISKLIGARSLLIQEVEEFLSFCDLENRAIFTMRFVAGFSFNSVEFRTGVSRKTFSRRVEAWLEKYNEIRDYR